MPRPRRHPVATLAAFALAALAACGRAPEAPAPLPPPDRASLRAIAGDPGVVRDDLARRIAPLFAGDVGETRALLILRDGKIVAERYAAGYGRDTRFLGWSLAKTVTGVLIGMLIADGLLTLDQPAPIPRWQRIGDPRGAITIRHLLQMRSGLRHAESASAPGDADTPRMLFLDGRDDMAGYAETQPLDHPAGERFAWSTATSVILADIATRTLTRAGAPGTRRAAMDFYLRSRLFDPLGMTGMFAEYDRAGTMIGGAMIHAPARDWARLGEFLRENGAVGGAQHVPAGWIAFMRRPSPGDPAFGAHLWLDRARGKGRRQVLFGGKGPPGTFAALGDRGQVVLVSPSQRLTVVRLGASSEEQQDVLNRRLRALLALFPRGQI